MKRHWAILLLLTLLALLCYVLIPNSTEATVGTKKNLPKFITHEPGPIYLFTDQGQALSRT